MAMMPPFGGSYDFNATRKLATLRQADEDVRMMQGRVAESAQRFAEAFELKGIHGSVRMNSGDLYGVCHKCGASFIRVIIRLEKCAPAKPLIARGRVLVGGELLATYDFCHVCTDVHDVKLNRHIFPKDLPGPFPSPQGSLQLSDNSI